MNKEDFIKKLEEISEDISKHQIKKKKFRIYCNSTVKKIIKDAIVEKYFGQWNIDDISDYFNLPEFYLEIMASETLTDKNIEVEELPEDYKLINN